MERHGLSNTQIYKVWAGIKGRTNPNNYACKSNYKKLNIKMCKEWKDSFLAFYRWAIENGYKEEKMPNGKNKYSIDRIDTLGDYCPENCRWATSLQQANNMTTNRNITYKGKTQTLADWCRELKLNYGLVEQRLFMGFGVERAFTESNDKRNYYYYKGEKLSVKDISEKTGLTVTNVWNRIRRGWDVERIMSQPARKFKER